MPRQGKINPVFGKTMRELRGFRSQREFAAMLGVRSSSTVRNYEEGRVPDPGYLERIAVRIGTTPDCLLSGNVDSQALAEAFKSGAQPSASVSMGDWEMASQQLSTNQLSELIGHLADIVPKLKHETTRLFVTRMIHAFSKRLEISVEQQEKDLGA